MSASFRDRLFAGDPLVGVWAKTPSHIVADVLGLSPLDVVCLDAEHAPFDRLVLDACLSALAKAGKPALVRTAKLDEAQILNALDCGADGVVCPHVRGPEDAARLARIARFGAGGRGYAGSTRMAGYATRAMGDVLASGAEVSVVAQIEDLEAVDAIDEIAAVEGVDCFFIGRIDLTVALGAKTPDAPEVVAAVQRICETCAARGRRVGMFVGDLDEIPRWRAAGANLFLLKSDHAFILEGARALRARFDQLARGTP